MKKLPKNSWLVFYNGTIECVEPEDPKIFASREKALAYIKAELKVYCGLNYYLCRVKEIHYTQVKRTAKVKKL